MTQIFIVLPAYNEEKSLPSLLNRIQELNGEFSKDPKVIVINDGSKDQTPQILKEYSTKMNLHYVDVYPNQGLANAIRTGIEEVLKFTQKGDIVVTLDADDSHNPHLIKRMAGMIKEGSEIVIASRYQNGARIMGLTKIRELYSEVASILFKTIVGMKGVKDYTCGFRAYDADFLKKLQNHYKERLVEEKGFSCMAEILLKSNRFNPIIHEVPMILRYDFKLSDSKMKVARTINLTLGLLWAYRFSKRFK